MAARRFRFSNKGEGVMFDLRKEGVEKFLIIIMHFVKGLSKKSSTHVK